MDLTLSAPAGSARSFALLLGTLACLTSPPSPGIPLMPVPLPSAEPNAAILKTNALERFQDSADRRARNYDRAQDTSARQLLVLLDVSERTGYSLGQLLATGEHESAHTWNDFVRPPLSGGRVGAAAGVWQFQPRTFERVIHLYGQELLDLTDADPDTERRRLDLGFGPFCDSHVRLIIQDTVDGLRNPDDQELRLLRHNFTVLAFAKYLLSRDSGAKDPVEDYLFHFLGPAQGRRILTWARGDARHTRTVKPPPPPEPSAEAAAARGAGDGLPSRPRLLLELAPRGYRQPEGGIATLPGTLPGARAADRMLNRPGANAPTPQPAPSASPQWPAPHGYEHDSPVVRGNAGMFYRDGRNRGDPYTWAEFLDHLSRRVRADQQPKLVRAKYGVGFPVKGGDMPQWLDALEQPGESIPLRLADGSEVPMAKAALTATLTDAEARAYRQRLAALIGLGEAEPGETLSDTAAMTLYRLGFLDGVDRQSDIDADPLAGLRIDKGPGVGALVTTEHPVVRKALRSFRQLVGKGAPDDETQVDLVLPAERVALEIYGRRIERHLDAAAERDSAGEQ